MYLLLERKHAVRALKQFVCDFAAATCGRPTLYCVIDNYCPHISRIRTDNAGEFVGSKSPFASYLRDAKVAHEFSPPHIHQKNGVAERINRSIANAVLRRWGLSALPLLYRRCPLHYRRCPLRYRRCGARILGVTPFSALSALRVIGVGGYRR